MGCFRDLVRERRGPRLKGDDKTLFSGEFWTGAKAVELGLVDGIGELRQTLRARYGEQGCAQTGRRRAALVAPPLWFCRSAGRAARAGGLGRGFADRGRGPCPMVPFRALAPISQFF